MSVYKFTYVVWRDQAENYYGKVLFFPDCLYDGVSHGNEASAVGASLQEIKNQLKKTLCLRLEQASFTEREEIRIFQGETKQATIRLSVRPRRLYNGLSFPIEEQLNISTPLFYRTSFEGVIEVECPMENLSFSCLTTDPFQRIARDFLIQYYQNQLASLVFLEQANIGARRWTTDTIQVSCRNKKTDSVEYQVSMGQLTHVATPYSRTFVRQTFIPPWGRSEELKKLTKAIDKMSAGLILVGPPRCGKSTLLAAAVNQLEQAYRKRNTEDNRRHGWNFCENRFWQSSASRLTAGTKWFGEWQKQVEDLISLMYSFRGILCLEDLVTLVSSEETPENSVAAFLTEFLQAGEVKIIGEATPRQLKRLRQLVPDFIEQFQLFFVSEMDASQTRAILTQMGQEFKKGNPEFSIAPEVPSAICELCRRFYRYESFPGSASRFWQKSVQKRQKRKILEFTENDVYSDFVDQTGLAPWLFRDEIPVSFDSIWKTLAERVVGQPEACQACAHAVVRFKTALNNPGKPIGSFLFCGPTGVGKTQLAKTLADYLFGAQSNEGPLNGGPLNGGLLNEGLLNEGLLNEGLLNEGLLNEGLLNEGLFAGPGDEGTQSEKEGPAGRPRSREPRLFRLDMSEYQNCYSAQRLIETTDGRPSPLIEFVRRYPFCVILFDEIEKAAPEAFDILLNLLDEGRLTDRLGRTTSFQNAIVIMTSNLGGLSRPDFGFGKVDSESRSQQNQDRYFQAAMDFFRPEFVNRIDRLVAFRSLDKESSRKIVALELAALASREGVSERQLRLNSTDALIDHLTEIGFDPVYGARPLQRTIESQVVTQLSRFLTQRPGAVHCTITLDWSDSICTVK